MALFFTADTHFGDHRTINIHRRPFATVAEMDEAIVAGWNAVVGRDDEVWHLGDVARRPADVPALLTRLNGIKHLVRGNNDDPATGDADGWASVQDYAELTLGGVPVVLCHYPFRSWNGQHRRSINLHGHSHGRLKPMPRQFDVGVDARGYRPVTLDVLLCPPAAVYPTDDPITRSDQVSAELTAAAYPTTPDGRYFVVRGRLWRRSDPSLPKDRRAALVAELMRARRAVGAALRRGDEADVATARAAVDRAKVALGERGPVWWQDDAPDLNRRMVAGTPYADWFGQLEKTGCIDDLAP